MNEYQWWMKLKQVDHRILLGGILLSAGLHYGALHSLSWNLSVPRNELVQNRQFVRLVKYKEPDRPREAFRKKLLQSKKVTAASASVSIPAPVAAPPAFLTEALSLSVEPEHVQPFVRVALAAPAHPSRVLLASAGSVGRAGVGNQVFGDCLEGDCPGEKRKGTGWSVSVGGGSGCSAPEASRSQGWVNSQLP